MTRFCMMSVLDSFPVTFAMDRAGLVGSDGETHQGIFDIAFLSPYAQSDSHGTQRIRGN